MHSHDIVIKKIYIKDRDNFSLGLNILKMYITFLYFNGMDKITVKNAHWVEIQTIQDGYDGVISVAEAMKNIPFEIKRLYYINNLIHHDQVMRGKHSHKKLQQVLFCINGSCTILLDDGSEKQEVILNTPHRGIYLGIRLWHELYDFKNNCILLVLASDYYDEQDYIRNYDEFIEYIRIS